MANTQSREFRIALCGFSDREEKVLVSAFKLSGARSRQYSRWKPGRDSPHICVLNEDDPAGRSGWNEIRRGLSGVDFPILRVGLQDAASNAYDGVASVFVKRPLLAIRILKALDNLVTEVYHFAPELAIHDGMSTNLVADPSPAATQSSEEARSILVVDDSEPVRLMMEMRLTKLGYRVDFAETGEDALEKAHQRTYDLIFLDVMLPGIDGFDVSRALKRSVRVQAPIVMLTSKASRIDRLRGSLASADAYLTKPLSIDQLNDTLQRYLG